MPALLIPGIILIVFIVMYNSLVRKRNETANAFGSIDAMLKKRFDLIPNLVATVQQYAKYEESTFSKITALRSQTYNSLSEQQKAEFDRNFNEVKKSFFMLAENYPQLRASENFMHLQRTLNETEEQLSASRRTYNASVTDYNNAVMTFPSNVIANIFGFKPKEILTLPEAEKVNPQIKDLFQP